MAEAVSVRRRGRLVLYTLRARLTDDTARALAAAVREQSGDALTVLDLRNQPGDQAAVDTLVAAVAARLAAGAKVVVVNPPADAQPLFAATGALLVATVDLTGGTDRPSVPDPRGA